MTSIILCNWLNIILIKFKVLIKYDYYIENFIVHESYQIESTAWGTVSAGRFAPRTSGIHFFSSGRWNGLPVDHPFQNGSDSHLSRWVSLSCTVPKVPHLRSRGPLAVPRTRTCNVFSQHVWSLGIHRTQVGDLQPVCPRAACHALEYDQWVATAFDKLFELLYNFL